MSFRDQALLHNFAVTKSQNNGVKFFISRDHSRLERIGGVSGGFGQGIQRGCRYGADHHRQRAAFLFPRCVPGLQAVA